MLKKILVLVITLIVIGFSVVLAQTPSVVPLPHTYTLPQNITGVSQQQAQRLFDIRDQRMLLEAMRNEGIITESYYDTRLRQSWSDESKILETLNQSTWITLLMGDGGIESAIKRLWVNWSPGWPSARTLYEWIGFSLQQPPSTRAACFPERYMIRVNITPLTDQNYNSIKQQLEKGLGVSLVLNPDFAGDPVNNTEYKYVIRSNKSASGKPYLVTLSRRLGSVKSIYLEIAELTRDP
jgi:hypothetical protein